MNKPKVDMHTDLGYEASNEENKLILNLKNAIIAQKYSDGEFVGTESLRQIVIKQEVENDVTKVVRSMGGTSVQWKNNVIIIPRNEKYKGNDILSILRGSHTNGNDILSILQGSHTKDNIIYVEWARHSKEIWPDEPDECVDICNPRVTNNNSAYHFYFADVCATDINYISNIFYINYISNDFLLQAVAQNEKYYMCVRGYAGFHTLSYFYGETFKNIYLIEKPDYEFLWGLINEHLKTKIGVSQKKVRKLFRISKNKQELFAEKLNIFFSKIPQKYFLYPKSIALGELLLLKCAIFKNIFARVPVKVPGLFPENSIKDFVSSEPNEVGIKGVFWSNEMDRAQCFSFSIAQKRKKTVITNWPELCECEYEKTFVTDMLLPLITVISENIKNNNAELIALITIYRFAISFYANQFIQERQIKVSEFDDLELEDSIKKFIENEWFDANDTVEQSKCIYFLMSIEKFQDNYNFLSCSKRFLEFANPLFEKKKRDSKVKRLEKMLSVTETGKATKHISIFDVDLMTGVEFERAIGDIFDAQGYQISYTKTTGDQGIDIIAEKNGYKIGIQAKRYTGSVGNAAVQEAVAGKQYYGLDKAMVITNSTFTQAAIDLANANDIVLWDREVLKDNL